MQDEQQTDVTEAVDVEVTTEDNPSAQDAAANADPAGEANEPAPEGAKTEEAPASKADTDEPPEKSKSKLQRERRRERMEMLERQRKDAEAAKERIVNPGKQPEEDDYDDHLDFVAAKAVYAARNADATTAKEQAEAEATRIGTELKQSHVDDYNEQAAEARGVYQDYDAVVGNAPISETLGEAIVQSEMSADLAYAIGSNPEEARRLSTLDPVRMARELGRIEASLSRPTPKLVSKAPPPITPVTPSGSAPANINDMDDRAYIAMREKEIGYR